MTFLASGQATTDPQFRLRIQAALFKLAQDVHNEDPSTASHAVRARLANEILQGGPAAVVERFVWLCASNPTIAASVSDSNGTIQVQATDGDIEYVCASYWTTVADWIG